jgi:hypothetical protein
MMMASQPQVMMMMMASHPHMVMMMASQPQMVMMMASQPSKDGADKDDGDDDCTVDVSSDGDHDDALQLV